MVEIEFLEPVGRADEPRPAGAAPPSRRTALSAAVQVLPAALWALAAALAMTAPFREIYSIHIHEDLVDSTQRVDGWGRLAEHQLPAEHAPRYGVVYTVCAALFAVAALTALFRLAGARRRKRGPAVVELGTGLAAAGLLAGVGGAIGLDVRATFSNLRAEVHQSQTPGDNTLAGSFPHLDLHVGGCLWLTAVGTAAGLLAVLVRVLLAWRRDSTGGVLLADPVAAPPELSGDDELLGTRPD
jgi:hypothetical protein